MGIFKKVAEDDFELSRATATSVNQKKKGYQSLPSISSELPWMEYDSESECFLLQDGVSAGAVFEIEDIACEASPQEYLEELRNRFQSLFQNTLEQEINSPWHLQFFLQDELSLKRHVDEVKNYVKPQSRGDKYTDQVLDMYEEHCQILTKKGGLFRDTSVTGNLFQGRIRRIRLVIYRLVGKETSFRKGQGVLESLNNVARKIENQLSGSDVKVRRCQGKDFYEWMLRWFNPNPLDGQYTVDELINEVSPYPGDDEMPFGFDFAEQLFKSTPENDQNEGVWYFDGQPHALLTVQALSAIPKVGHITAERKQGKQRYGLFDRMPEGSVFVMNIVIEHQTDVINHIKNIYNSCAGGNVESVLARRDCQSALYQIEQGNYLFPTSIGVYVRAESLEKLHRSMTEAESILTNSGFKVIKPEVELTPCDAYLRFLPMAFNHDFDKNKGMRRSKLIYARQIANMLPLYGRNRGSGNPCFMRWNRLGEPFCFDQYSKKDKSANSHMLYLAETGGGKSASLVWDLMCFITIYNPRVFIIEAGDSFRLFCDHAKKYGKNVNQVTLSNDKPTALNPFADAFKILESEQEQDLSSADERIGNLVENLNEEFSENEDMDDQRDILGEMALAAQLMITGGDPKDEAKFTRANRTVVLEAILDATKYVKESGRPEVIAEDIVSALERVAKAINESGDNPQKVSRIYEMADSMRNFTSDSFSAKFFNRVGKAWPDADITRLDMGLMKADNYSSQLALAVMGMLNRIAHIAEVSAYKNRMTLVLIDESHILTKNPLTAASLTQFSKMSRKLGMWLLLATQNMSDFPDESKKMLSMIEFWIGLGTSESEVDEMRRFKKITDEEKELFLSVHKQIPNYVEGVVLSRNIKGLFRNVPPRLPLTLGMTDHDEKVERARLMREHSVTELGAAELMAEELKGKLTSAEVR